MKKQNNPVEVLIGKIKTDQQLFIEKTKIFEEAKEEQREIQSRIKGYKKDVAHMWSYMSPEQQAEIESLELDVHTSSGRSNELNPFSKITIETLQKAKGKKMTNGDLYSVYIDSVGDGEPIGYALFNVKIRQAYSRGLIRKEQIDPNKASRDDIIILVIDSSQK